MSKMPMMALLPGKLRKRRGAALILVLGAVSVLTVLAVELASRASAETLRTGRGIRDAGFRRLADSGLEVARGLLLEREPRDFVCWGDTWNRRVEIRLAQDEQALVHLADESGKINLAQAWLRPEDRGMVRARASRLFEYLRRREPQRARVLKEIEAKLLRRLAAPDPLVTLDGLREAGLSVEEVFGPGGLEKYFTCFGDGRVNLNTAPRAVIFALDEEFDESVVDRVAAFRGRGEGENGEKGGYRAFEDPKDLMLIDGIVVRTYENGQFRVARNLFEKVQGFLSVNSSAFSARVSAEIRGRRRDTWIFLKPDTTRLAMEEIVP